MGTRCDEECQNDVMSVRDQIFPLPEEDELSRHEPGSDNNLLGERE
jgi:hypothetical protein